jgi:DNA-binding transcriptional LysR family regulator
VRRLEAKLGVRLLNRTTRSVAPTEAGTRLLERLSPRSAKSRRARCGQRLPRSAGGHIASSTCPPASRARAAIDRPPFLKAYPDIRLEVTVEDRFVDVLAAGCDAGIRYDERLEQDMIAVPIGPRTQRYRHRRLARLSRRRMAGPSIRATCSTMPAHAADLPAARRPYGNSSAMTRSCGSTPPAPLVVRNGAAFDLAIAAAVDGLGIIHLFEDWLRPHFVSGALEPVLEPWWQSFSGPFLYYPGRRHLPRRSAPSSISSAITADKPRHAEPAHAPVSYTTCACGTSWLTTS